MKKYRAGILGATGLVGQRFVNLLRTHPYFELVCLTASQRLVGRKYREVIDWYLKEDIPENIGETILIDTTVKEISQQEIDVVFSALPGSYAQSIEVALAKEEITVFSNANAHRMDKDVPILIPEINPDHIQLVSEQKFGEGFIVTNSNCSTSGLVFGLRPLEKFGIKSVYITTFQSVSGAGKRGVHSMDILGNIIPFIAGEEEKIEMETKKILGKFNGQQILNADFNVNASCARVPVVEGHLESIAVDLKEEVSLEKINKAFESFKGLDSRELHMAPNNPIILSSEEDRPQPAKDLLNQKNAGMSITIGRIRKRGSCVNFFLLVHNTLRGAAGASILNAEFALKEKYLN